MNMNSRQARPPRPLSKEERAFRRAKRGKACQTCRIRKCNCVVEDCPRAGSRLIFGLLRWLLIVLGVLQIDAKCHAMQFPVSTFPGASWGSPKIFPVMTVVVKFQLEPWTCIHTAELKLLSHFEERFQGLYIVLPYRMDREENVPKWIKFQPAEFWCWFEGNMNQRDQTWQQDATPAFTSRGRGSAWQVMRFHSHRRGPIYPSTLGRLREAWLHVGMSTCDGLLSSVPLGNEMCFSE